MAIFWSPWSYQEIVISWSCIHAFSLALKEKYDSKNLDFSTRIQYIYLLKYFLATCLCIADPLFSRNFRFYSDSSDNTNRHIIDEDSNLVKNKYEEESIVKKYTLIVWMAWGLFHELREPLCRGFARAHLWRIRSSILTTASFSMLCGPVLEIPLMSCPNKFLITLNNSKSFCCIFIKLSTPAHYQHAQPFNCSCKLGLRRAAHILTH